MQIFYVYVRYIHINDINEDLLFCKALDKHMTGMDIFQKVHDFFTEMGLQWKDCVGICTDGGAAMIGHTFSFHNRVRSASDLSITFIHCMTQQEALVAKKFLLIFIPLFKMM